MVDVTGTSETRSLIDLTREIKTEPRGIYETRQIVEKIFTAIVPKYGVNFLIPNVILAISGIKGTADIRFVVEDETEFQQQVDKLLSVLSPYRITFEYGLEPYGNSFIVTGLLTSLLGVDYKSSRFTELGRLYGFTHYDSNNGFENYRAWHDDLEKKLEQAVREGKLLERDTTLIRQGIELGYPDRAILDFVHCLNNGDIYNDLVNADILSAHPEAIQYSESVPEFDYYPTSAYDSEIVENIANSRRLLRGFYDSEWVRKLMHSDQFRALRTQTRHKWQEYLSQRTRK